MNWSKLLQARSVKHIQIHICLLQRTMASYVISSFRGSSLDLPKHGKSYMNKACSTRRRRRDTFSSAITNAVYNWWCRADYEAWEAGSLRRSLWHWSKQTSEHALNSTNRHTDGMKYLEGASTFSGLRKVSSPCVQGFDTSIPYLQLYYC